MGKTAQVFNVCECFPFHGRGAPYLLNRGVFTVYRICWDGVFWSSQENRQTCLMDVVWNEWWWTMWKNMISAYLILSHQFIISHHIAGSLFPVPFSNLHSLICMQVGTLVVKGIQRSRFALACALSRVAQDSDCGDSRYPGQDVDVNNGMYVTRAYNHCCRELYVVINDCFF